MSPVKFATLVFFEEFNGASRSRISEVRENKRKEKIENRGDNQTSIGLSEVLPALFFISDIIYPAWHESI